MKIKVTRFDNNDKLWLDIDTQKPVGSGAQGGVFRVNSIEGRPITNELVKIYNIAIPGWTRDALREHLKVFINRVANPISFSQAPSTVKHSLWNYRGLEGLPRYGFDLDDGRFGFFMTFISGDTIELKNGAYEKLVNKNLATKVQTCYDVASCIYNLHDSGIIHCDISDDNTIINVSKKSNIFIIDADGGSILHPAGKQEPVTGGVALVKGKPAYMALEVEKGNHPSYDSDNWALGILLHKILLGHDLEPYSAMGWLGSSEIEKAFEWPPKPAKVSVVHKPWAEYQTRELKSRLGYLFDAFYRTFSFSGGSHKPTMRTKSLTWVNLFEKSSRWINKCPNCLEEFISWGQSTCPFCRKSIHCPTLTVAGKKFLLSEDLDIGDHNLGWVKQKTKSIIKLTRIGNPDTWKIEFGYDTLQNLETQRRYSPGNSISLIPGRNRFALIGNKERVEFSLDL
ncbi:MAG: protein kinase [Anaerolineales bacterium]|nr:protein kinase [Anaerolineales bacterium]